MLALLKVGGAFYMFIAITGSMPLAENLFTAPLPFVGSKAFSWFRIGGLVTIIAGLATYRIFTWHAEKYAALEYENMKAAGLLNADEVEDAKPARHRVRCCVLPVKVKSGPLRYLSRP